MGRRGFDVKEEPVLQAGDGYVLKLSTQRQAPSSSYTKVKEAKISYSGTVRVYFELTPANNSSSSIYARIYKNGSPVGTERYVDETSYSVWTTFVEDISVQKDDFIQLYVKGARPPYGYCRSFFIGISGVIGSVIIG